MRWRGWCAVLGACCVVPALAMANPKRPSPDRVWIHPGIENLRPERIAILPAVSFVFLPRERIYVEDAWLQRLSRSRHAWLPAVLCRERMAATSRHGDSLLNVIGDQVRNRGRVDSTSSPRLARLLQSQALLSLRIDRWERVGAARSTRIYVDMSAALVDSSGRLLWRVSSEERLESVYGLPKINVSEPPEGTSLEEFKRWRAATEGNEARLVFGRPGEMGAGMQSSSISPDFQAALTRILTRWVLLFPETPRRPAVSIAR